MCKTNNFFVSKKNFIESLLEELKFLDSPTCLIKKVGHLAWDLVIFKISIFFLIFDI